jgi:hypothetical protein
MSPGEVTLVTYNSLSVPRRPPPRWTRAERRALAALRTPAHVQAFLDELDYDPQAGVASPRVVLRTGKAQCLSGVLFACAALRELGFPPRLMFIDAVADDSHCVAVYEQGGLWGSVAKSNFTTLRSRDPVYPYLALGLSYFEGYYNQYGQRTMRSFTVPLELERFEPRGWRFAERELGYIDRAIDRLPKAWTLPRGRARHLSRAGELLRRAGLLGSKAEGLWRRPR